VCGGGEIMKVTLQITVDDSLSADLRVLLGKVQCANERAACDHPRAITWLNQLPKAIDNAAGYQASLELRATGFQHCNVCRALIYDGHNKMGQHITGCPVRAAEIAGLTP
jgi:hypothetical protein